MKIEKLLCRLGLAYTLVALALPALKLIGIIHCSWTWILLPIYIVIISTILVCIGILIMVFTLPDPYEKPGYD